MDHSRGIADKIGISGLGPAQWNAGDQGQARNLSGFFTAVGRTRRALPGAGQVGALKTLAKLAFQACDGPAKSESRGANGESVGILYSLPDEPRSVH
jgi:hypothetical protein